MTASIYTPDFKTTPYWWEAAPPENVPDPLPAQVDVLVVGSGYCGLTAAADLARAGMRVAVVDRAEIGAGGSTRSGGMVSSGQKLVVSNAIKGVSPDRLKRLLNESLRSFNYLKSLVHDNSLDADLAIPGRFFGAYTPAHATRLREQGQLLRDRTGVTVHDIDRLAQRDLIGSNYYYGGILVDDYGGVHTAKYHRSLRDLARRHGATLHSHAGVTNIVRRGPENLEVSTARGTVSARHVVMAVNGYADGAMPWLQRRLVPVASYQIATEPLPPGLLDEINPRRLMISDSKRNLFYTRPSPDGTRLLFGSRPSVTETSEEAAGAMLRERMLTVWPQLRDTRISHVWKGYVAMTFDRLSHIGEHDGIHYAVGCNGNGVALMSYLGHMIAQKLIAREHYTCAFEEGDFAGNPLGGAQSWLVPLAAAAYEIGDKWDARARDASVAVPVTHDV